MTSVRVCSVWDRIDSKLSRFIASNKWDDHNYRPISLIVYSGNVFEREISGENRNIMYPIGLNSFKLCDLISHSGLPIRSMGSVYRCHGN